MSLEGDLILSFLNDLPKRIGDPIQLNHDHDDSIAKPSSSRIQTHFVFYSLSYTPLFCNAYASTRQIILPEAHKTHHHEPVANNV